MSKPPESYELSSLERNRLAWYAGCVAKELNYMLVDCEDEVKFQAKLEAIVLAFSESFGDLMIDFAMDDMNEFDSDDDGPDEDDEDFEKNVGLLNN